MKRNLVKFLLVLLMVGAGLVGCSSNPPESGPVVAPQKNRPPAQKPALPPAPKPPVVVSRIEPTPAVKKVIAQARTARHQDRFDQALLLLDRAQRMAPKAGEVYLEMARVNRQMGQLAKAEQLYLKAISLSASDKWFRRQVQKELDALRRKRNS